MTTRTPWTPEELKAETTMIDRRLKETEHEYPGARPVPPMTVDECKEHFFGLMGIAAEQPLTRDQCFLHGQLLSVLISAVRAEMLGKKGRYFVLSEEDIAQSIH
jgi:hypothetical protein